MSKKNDVGHIYGIAFSGGETGSGSRHLKLDLGKALEIALSENPTVKVADKEIQKKKYARKGSYASLFPQISFAGDYNRTLKKQVMYMDFDMGDMGGGSLPEGTDMSSMDEGFEVGRSNNWSLGFNASMPLVNASFMEKLEYLGLRRGIGGGASSLF